MEVATTATANTHNHSHHSHHRSDHFPHPEEEQHIPAHRAHNGFGVGLISNGTGSGSGARSPFQREVREWQRIDPDTGALLTGRVEADRWINGPMNSYGKISDSQNISQPNGTQHTQRKQLEVLQARTASGAMQVIRAQTVQTTSSRWSSSASTSASTSTSSSAIASPIITGSSAINGHSHIHSKNNTNLESSSLLMPSLLTRMSTLNRTQSSDSTSSSDVDVESKNLTQNSPLSNGPNDIRSNKLSTHVPILTPSQKLSNLMKSNSSLSNNNNNSKNSTTMNNTHHKKSAADKISLHAIVGAGENVRRITSSPSPSLSSLATMKSTSNWQQQQQRSSQLFEQPTLFGNGNQCQSLSKSRVGVNAAKSSSGCTAGDGVTTIAAVVINEGGDGDSTTPTQLKSIQQKQDLESFRHNNEHQSSSTLTSTSTVVSALDDDYDDDEIDDALRLSKRHQRRQQIPQHDTAMRLQRSRSISTDDLTSELEKHTESDNEDAGEWRRVSKLRRSFQSTSSNSKKESSTQPRRPIDLPTNSVSVARIRAELENGRRLNTAMRNNCVNLAALDTILNGNDESPKPVTSKCSSFLTAESLKEIRAGLKKLSDESLYRDDYVPTVQNAASDENIEIQDIKKPPERIRTRQLLAEKLTEITPPKSAFQVFTRPLASLDSPTNSYLTQRSLPIGSSQKHTTHSLESRQKTRESAASIDWHLRRKSYGFEKMSPPDNKTIFNKDASIDSGLGRSGEQLGNWSPIESGTPTTRATVIHFVETPKVVANPSNPTVVKRVRHLKSPESVDADAELKRHSIAVDESQYIRENVRKTSQVHLNGYYNGTTEPETSTSRLLVSSEATISSRNANQQKRVEFCKTEVHFAAESGRVNIVETDGKPPPTNNFRRRRRTTSGPLQTIVKSASTINDPLQSSSNSINRPITHFGDTRQSSMVPNYTIARRSSSQEPLPAVDFEMSSVTFTMPKPLENSSTLFSSSRACYALTSGVETTDGETDEMSAIRGILKNKPAKPRPYHLGENVENADALWGVQLRPVGETVNHEGPKNASPPLISSASVAERVRIVEQRQDTASSSQSNGFSTKINLSLVDDPKVWPDTELPKSNVMSIELHSPHTSLDSSDAKLVQATLPVAKPRTFMSTKNSEETHSKVISKEARENPVNKEANNDFLKIVKETRGARKLREHELSYFGVPAPKDAEIEIKPSFPSSQGKSLKRNLPTQRKTNEEHHKSSPKTESMSDTTKQQVITKWQLINDKPDLLRHSPIAIETQSIATTTKIRPVERKSLNKPSDSNDESGDHVYENIAIDIKPIFRVKSPSKADEKHYEVESHYNRKMDLKRDAIILNEMTENADQSLKALSDEAAIKDQRRRSLHRRNSKPLETIDEKTIAERINDKCIAVKITRSTLASKAKRVPSRHISPSPTKQSSRTRSSSQSSNENENVKIRPKRSPTSLMRSRNPKSESRSSSHVSQNSVALCCSSGDDEPIKRADLLRIKKSKAIPTDDIRRHSNKDPLHQRDKVQTSAGPLDKLLRRGDDHKKRSSSSTAHSSCRERVEYNDEVKTHHSRHHYDKKQHHPLTESTGSRKNKDQKSICSTTKNLEEKRERDKSRSSTKGSDHRHHASPIHRDVEREKSSRSKGHSSRSSELKNERIDGISHEKHRDSPTKLREHKKSTINSKQRDLAAPTTHSKIAPIISEQNQHQHANGNHENHHLHSMTTATIAAKHRSGKDRK